MPTPSFPPASRPQTGWGGAGGGARARAEGTKVLPSASKEQDQAAKPVSFLAASQIQEGLFLQDTL